MKTVIYVEGPDCGGKSTLIEAIKKDEDLVIHNGRYLSPEDAYQAYIDQLKEFATSNYDRLILDRGVLSEVIYGMVCRNKMPSEIHFKVIVDLLQQFDYDIIICLPPFGKTVIKWAQRQDLEYVNQFEEYVMIYDMFQKIQLELPSEVLYHDYTSNNQEVIDYVNSK